MPSPQTLSETDRRLLARWAADCAERVLPLLEAEAPEEVRARDGIARSRAFGAGELDAAGQIRRRFEAGRAASVVTGAAAVAAARAAGQASGVAHMGAHALGAAAYAAKAAGLAAGTGEVGELARRAEVRWQLDRLAPAARAALARLPALGEDSSGPLGPGLLTAPALAVSIRDIQAEVGTRESSA